MPSREPVQRPRRPSAPAAVALVTWFFSSLALTGLLSLLPRNVVAFQRGVSGALTLGVFLGVGMYFVTRSRIQDWERKEAASRRLENEERNVGRPRCARCGIAVTGAEQPWQQAGYCSEKCRRIHASPAP
jgi:hypothetical protein